mmetsp:Transcript_18599/g.17696  ORF Transcript_18599/g.17696 Transcript_18599/m.17696 type:complete len:151 (-) Transcript_18599:331-783(-)
MQVKGDYESSSSCKTMLVPRKYNSMLYNPETVTYAITGGNDKRIRFWDFLGLQKKSFYLNTPLDDECQYYAENLGDSYVVQEKINQFKQFPQLNQTLATKQFDGVLPTANLSLAGNNAYYGVLANIMLGQEQVIADGGINAVGANGVGQV